MNKKLRFFKLLAALFLMLIPAEQPVGQNITYEFPGIQLKNSIIRSYDAKKSFIIYTDDGANRKFSYFDPTSSNDVSADFTSANVIVNDMKVVGDQVFFCGYSPSSPGAAFGYFDIGSVFFGSGPIYVSFVPGYTVTLPNGVAASEELNNFLQIEVQKLSTNDIHIYMIADANYFVGGTMSNDYRCVVDVWETGSGGGDFTANEEFSGVYFFNDLVITDNKLVVVGDKRGGTGQYMHEYSLPPSLTPSVFNISPAIITYWFVNDYLFYPIPEVRVAHIDHDVFAVACQGYIYDVKKGIVVSIYGSVGQLIDRILIDDPFGTDQIRDLECRSEKSTDGWRLYLVPEFGNTNKRNSQYVIDVSSAYIMNSVQLLTPNDIDELHSLTINAENETELSGTTTGALRVWQTATTNDACAQSIRVPFEHFWFPESNSIFKKYVGNGKYSYRTFYPIVVNVTRDYICK